MVAKLNSKCWREICGSIPFIYGLLNFSVGLKVKNESTFKMFTQRNRSSELIFVCYATTLIIIKLKVKLGKSIWLFIYPSKIAFFFIFYLISPKRNVCEKEYTIILYYFTELLLLWCIVWYWDSVPVLRDRGLYIRPIELSWVNKDFITSFFVSFLILLCIGRLNMVT